LLNEIKYEHELLLWFYRYKRALQAKKVWEIDTFIGKLDHLTNLYACPSTLISCKYLCSSDIVITVLRYLRNFRHLILGP